MPLNLTDFPQAWYTDQELEASDDVFPSLAPDAEVDEEDAFLLSDMLTKLPGASNGSAQSKGATPGADRGGITWLRRTEYLGAEQQKRRADNQASMRPAEVIDASRGAQIRRIKESFVSANKPLGDLRHPTKPNLRAVDEYSLLPDQDTWASRYDVFRFGDMPGRSEGSKAQHDPRLEVALLRPHKDLLNETIYSLFLVDAPEDDTGEAADGSDEDGDQRPRKKRAFRSKEEQDLAENKEAARLVRSRLVGETSDAFHSESLDTAFDVVESSDQSIHMGHKRDYQAHDETNRQDQELVFSFLDRPSTVLHDEAQEIASENGTLPPATQYERSFRQKNIGEPSGKVVYYHPVSTRAQLRVQRRKVSLDRRVNACRLFSGTRLNNLTPFQVTDPRPPQHWDVVALGKRSLSTYEKVERLHERKVLGELEGARLPEPIELPAVQEEMEDESPSAANGGTALSGEDSERDKDDLRAKSRGRAYEDENDEDDDQMPRLARKGRAKSGASDREHDGPTRQGPRISSEEGETRAAAEDKGDDEGADEGEQGGSGSESASGSDSGSDASAQSDEEMDDDELAALRAEAGGDAMDEDQGDDDEAAAGGGRTRRSRRAAAADGASADTEEMRAAQRARNAELGGDAEEDE